MAISILKTATQASNIDTSVVQTAEIPRFIVIEGPIGVGKTTLAKRLANRFNYDTLLEKAEENPFLSKFYKNRDQHALSTQLFFLFQRAQQLEELWQNDLFEPLRVADFLIEKDHLFAKTILTPEEYQLYQMVYEKLAIEAPKPDLVIYLQAPVDTLLSRIHHRGIKEERHINHQYLERLNEAYSEFFLYYDDAPLLIVNASQIDLVDNDRDFEQLADYMLTIKRGRHFFNPSIL